MHLAGLGSDALLAYLSPLKQRQEKALSADVEGKKQGQSQAGG